MNTLTVETLNEVLQRRFSGVLTSGRHEPNGEACALELVSVAREVPWTDDPTRLGMPDVRRLNDARWSSNAIRTQTMLPMIAALSGWSQWSQQERQGWIDGVVVRTVKEIVADLPHLPLEVRKQCRQVVTREEARTAAYAAAAYAAAAYAAADAAAYAGDKVLILACGIWQKEALKVTGGVA